METGGDWDGDRLKGFELRDYLPTRERRAGAFNPGARLVAPKQSTGKRLTPKEREKLRKQREKDERRMRREQREKGKENPGSPRPDHPNPGGPGR